jgi:type IV pilus assembly protein PilM
VVALIDAGANVMNLTVLRNGQQVYAREQAFGGGQLTQDIARHYGMNFEDAEAAKRAGNLPEGYEIELLNPFMENLALEVSRALQFFFTSTQYNQVDHIVLAGGCAVIPGIDEVVATVPRSTRLLQTRLPIWCYPTAFGQKACLPMPLH